MRLSLLIPVALGSLASCASLVPRQGSNTNGVINAIVDALSQSVWLNIPDVEKNLANQTNSQIDGDVDNLVSAYNAATSALNNVPTSTGSNTTAPTDNDIRVTFAALLSQTASGLSSVTTDRIADRDTKFATLDTSISNTISSTEKALPGTIAFLQIMLIDARQFFGRDDFTKSLATLGLSGSL